MTATAKLQPSEFLDRNGWDIEAPKEDTCFTFLHLAEGKLSEDALATWFSKHAVLFSL